MYIVKRKDSWKDVGKLLGYFDDQSSALYYAKVYQENAPECHVEISTCIGSRQDVLAGVAQGREAVSVIADMIAGIKEVA